MDVEKLLEQLAEVSDHRANQEWIMSKHLDTLKKYFGHQHFRSLQWKIIKSIIEDRRDNFAVMQTGYGKSLCFQYPPIYMEGVAIVITPLISLMEDQVFSLKVANIPACLLGTANSEQRKTISDIFQNKYRLIYMTPEFCCGDFGTQFLKDLNNKVTLNLIAIDEAHCVSTWGHDFRSAYLKLNLITEVLPDVPVLAVTATATKKVQDDIINILKLRNPQRVCSGFDRPNLYFAAYQQSKSIYQDFKSCMVYEDMRYKFPGSTIIYCLTRKQTESIAELLNVNGIECQAYHAGLSVRTRRQVHEGFIKDKINCIVATIAFGMGIDKPDVRTVIHYGASSNVESYYQEVGRAGRDGLPSKCILFYSNRDFRTHKFLRENSTSNQDILDKKESMAKIMQKYIHILSCRREFILNYFEDKYTNKVEDCCDNCTNSKKPKLIKYEGMSDKGEIDLTEEAYLLLSVINEYSGRFGLNKILLALRGSHSKKIELLKKSKFFGAGAHKTDDYWKVLARLLEEEKYTATSKQSMVTRFPVVSIASKGSEFLQKYSKKANPQICFQPTSDLVKVIQPVRPKYDIISEPEERTQLQTINFDLFKKAKPKDTQTSTSTSTATATSTSKLSTSTLSKNEESEEAKNERLRIFNELRKARNAKGFELNIMPYQIASDEALMNMAKCKPITMDQFIHLKLPGFSDAKIKKFADIFITLLKSLCPDKKAISTIHEILSDYSKFAPPGPSALTSYEFLKAGLSVDQIVEKRRLVRSSVIRHLTTCIKSGYTIKMKELQVTDQVIKTIIDVINNNAGLEFDKLPPIKLLCPEEITYDDIIIVTSYLQIREHLATLEIEYEEFEDFNYYELVQKKDSVEPIESLTQQSALNYLLDIADIAEDSNESLTQQSALNYLLDIADIAEDSNESLTQQSALNYLLDIAEDSNDSSSNEKKRIKLDED